MIKSIRFENFYSFKDITITLHEREFAALIKRLKET